MKKFILIALFGFLSIATYAQREVMGTITDDEGMPLIGANVLAKGTTAGTITDIDGKYVLVVPKDVSTIIVSYTGYDTREFELGATNVMDVKLTEGVTLETAVVTALGITRDKQSLGYSTQVVDGEELTNVKSGNFVNALSGKTSGVQIKRNTNMGGSTNVIIRGNTSLTGNNQALFVVDGVPISNEITNNVGQAQGQGNNYDYGNAASDINPEDIASVNVLKGAAATALYGSRAANGVIMITTKKGDSTKKGIGITLSTGLTVGFMDKSTFPAYQKEYGAGYGPYYDGPDSHWFMEDIDGDGELDQVALVSEDASYGAAFDENLLVYQWDALDPASPNYLKKTAWKYPDNDAATFFETPLTFTNSISIDKGFDIGSFRLGYTNFDQKGLMPNSKLKRHNFTFSTAINLNKKWSVSGFANYIKTEGLGRNSTGYNDNIVGMFRQWWQTNVDLKDQRDIFESTDRNVTWNYGYVDDLNPIYWDNPYWTRHKNFQDDTRDRIIGNASVKYQITDWLDVTGRIATDTYSELQQERRAVGSVPSRFGVGADQDGSVGRSSAGSGYAKKEISFRETNFDLMLNFDRNLTEKLSLKGVLGTNIRRGEFSSTYSSTNGGLNIPGLYSLQNSVGPLLFPKEVARKTGVDGVYGLVSFGYDRLIYVDATLRTDVSSTLPIDNNSYVYPSIATSFIFSNLLENSDWLSFGKLRLNYAKVGNDAPFDSVNDIFNIYTPINGAAVTSANNTKRNPVLKPEITNSLEAGLEVFILNKRLGFDVSYYKTNSTNQIFNLRTTPTTGYSSKVVNAGDIENSGIELSLFGTPFKRKDFRWDVGINWAKNSNKVVKLIDGTDNIQLGSFQGGVTINATVGEPFGTIQGTDFTYHEDGGKLIDGDNGEYLKTTTSDNVLGNINPEWNGGISNKFSYKGVSFSFLIDIQKGGSIFSLDQYYGLATGLYEETAGNNDLGNPVRNTIDEGGGFINEGVNANGEVNTTRINASRFGAWGYRRGLPNANFVYDAGYVKLREVALSYALPARLFGNSFIQGVSVSIVGSNLWIIHKNLPHADPEAVLGAGNLTGYSTGSLPTTRDFGFNVKVQF